MIIGRPMFTVEQIQDKVKELASKISADYAGQVLIAVCILRGAFIFFADIVRAIKVPMTVDFIIASSYIKTDTSAQVKIHADLREDVKGRNVLLIEDIADTGITLNYVREMLLSRLPNSLKICVLLDKKERRVVDVPIDYVGFEIPNEFVVGYGLDYDNKFRNLPYIAIFKKST